MQALPSTHFAELTPMEVNLVEKDHALTIQRRRIFGP